MNTKDNGQKAEEIIRIAALYLEEGNIAAAREVLLMHVALLKSAEKASADARTA